MTGKCITYPAEENRLEECRGMYPEVDWRETVHVQIKQSHQGEGESANQFEEANFEDESDETNSSEDGNPDEAQKYEDILPEENKGKVGKYEVIHQLKEQQCREQEEETKLSSST